MSHSTNSNVNFCDVCDLSFETKKGLYRHQSYDSKQKELLEKMFGSDDEAPTDVKPKVERVIRLERDFRYLENTEYFDINCSQNMKEFYITDKAVNYI